MKSFLGVMKLISMLSIVMMLASCGGAEERKVKYIEKGKIYLQENNLDKARVEFKNVLQIDPKFPEAYFYMGALEEKNKELRKAIGYYNKAIELDPEYINPKVKLAKIFVVVGTKEYIDKSKGLLKEVYEKDRNNSEAKLISATIEYKTGNKSKAIKDIENIVKADLSLIEGISLLSVIYDTNGEMNKAIELLENGVNNNQYNIPLKMSLAKMYAKTDNLAGAEKELLEIIKLEPEKYAYRVALSTFYSTSGSLDKAEKILRDSISDGEEDVQRYLVLLEFLASKRGVDQAVDELLVFINKNPEMVELKFALSKVYLKKGEHDKVEKVLTDIINEEKLNVNGIKARNDLARIKSSKGDIDVANKLIGEVLKEYPNNNDALLLRGKLSFVEKDVVTAINDLRTVLKNEPKNTDAAMMLARAHVINKEFNLAEDTLKSSLSANPLDYKSHLNYVVFLMVMNRADEAEVMLDKALLYFKDNYEIYDAKLKLAVAEKNDSKILNVLNQMKLNVPDNDMVFVKRGEYYLSKKEYDLAVEEFELALTKTGDKYKPLNYIIKIYSIQEKTDAAIQRLNKRLSNQINDPVSYQLLGSIYLAKKDYIKAHNNFSKAIENASKWQQPYVGLATIYLQQNDLNGAISVYKDAESKISNPVSIKIQLASLYEKLNQVDNAVNEYEGILKISPSNKMAANNLASLLVEKSSDEMTLTRAKELTKGFGALKQPAYQDTLAWVYVKSGENDKAVKVLEEVVKNAPKVAVFKYHYAVALNNLGDKQNAKKYLIQAVESDQVFVGKEDAKKLLNTY